MTPHTSFGIAAKLTNTENTTNLTTCQLKVCPSLSYMASPSPWDGISLNLFWHQAGDTQENESNIGAINKKIDSAREAEFKLHLSDNNIDTKCNARQAMLQLKDEKLDDEDEYMDNWQIPRVTPTVVIDSIPDDLFDATPCLPNRRYGRARVQRRTVTSFSALRRRCRNLPV